jgi:vacuolar protein sorting-associated protein 13A/C
MATERAVLAADRALSVSFVQRPQDGSADAALDVVLTPSYVFYSAATVRRVGAFFTPPRELAALDFSGLSAAAATQLERARRAAAEYAAAALGARPRLRVRLALDAPKVAVPVEDARGRVTLALDLGRFVIESDHATAAALPPEEAGLYECLRLRGSNVSAYLADGEFDWGQLEQRGNGGGGGGLVPLLERCGMDVGLQAARYPEPRHPRLRLKPTVPVLHFYVSPGRIGRLLRVIHGALPPPAAPPGGGEDGGGGGGAPQGEAWRQHAEREGAVRVLTWTGLGRTTATWAPRHGVVYQGWLYLYDPDRPEKLVGSCQLWPDRRVARLPADIAGGCAGVLAVCPAGADAARAPEDPSCCVLRLEGDAGAGEWYRSLLAAQQAMQDVAGEGPAAAAGGPDWEGSSSAPSASDTDEGGGGGTPREDPAAAAAARRAAADEAPSVLLQVDAQLGEFAVFASGRAPEVWWPPGEGAGGPARSSAAAVDADADGEAALVVVRASGGTLGFSYGEGGMTVHTALAALEVEDLLVGRRSPEHCFLACSTRPGTGERRRGGWWGAGWGGGGGRGGWGGEP